MWYLGYTPVSVDASDVAKDTFSFLIIFNYIIPISLYVTLGEWWKREHGKKKKLKVY